MDSSYSSNLDARRANLDRLMKGGSQGDVATCENCGSTYFYSINAEQFSQQGYGSVEYNALGGNPRAAKVCLCGTPLPTKANARGTAQTRGAQEEFFRSLTAAREYIANNSIKTLAKVAATPQEVEAVKQLLITKVAELNDAIEALGKAKAPEKKPKIEGTHGTGAQ